MLTMLFELKTVVRHIQLYSLVNPTPEISALYKMWCGTGTQLIGSGLFQPDSTAAGIHQHTNMAPN